MTWPWREQLCYHSFTQAPISVGNKRFHTASAVTKQPTARSTKIEACRDPSREATKEATAGTPCVMIYSARWRGCRQFKTKTRGENYMEELFGAIMLIAVGWWLFKEGKHVG